MFKLLGLLLLSSLTVLPAASNVNQASFKNEPQYVAKLDGEEGQDEEIPYTEDRDSDYKTITRYYQTDKLTPSIHKVFCAPSGYKIVMNITDEQIDKIMSEMDSCNASYSLLVDCVYYYYLKGSRITSESKPFYPESREQVRDTIKNSVNNVTLFEVTELTQPTELSLGMEIEFCIDGATDESEFAYYKFFFNGDPIHFEPYNQYDFINIDAAYYQQFNDQRVTVIVETIPGFFKEYGLGYDTISYNESGFETDTTSPIYEGSSDYYADCEFTLLADDIPLGMSRTSYLGVEMTIPSETMSVLARLKFVSKGVEYTFYSKTILIGNPSISVAVDGYPNRTSVQRGVEHTFSFHFNEEIFPDCGTPYVSAYLHPYRLKDEELGHDLYQTGELPASGTSGHYYYVPSDEEIALYNEGDIETLNNMPYQGSYYTWDNESSSFITFNDILLFETVFALDEETGDYVLVDANNEGVLSIPYIGTWAFDLNANFECPNIHYFGSVSTQTIEAVSGGETTSRIIVNIPENGDVSKDLENINLVAGIGAIDVNVSVSSYNENIDYYYSYELSRDGVVEIENKGNGAISINPINYGVVQLTVGVECSEFSKITKVITIRVLDAVYDVAKIVVPDGFHKAGKDLTASIDIRGFTEFQNLDIDWVVTNKKGESVPENKIRKNGNASVTIINPDSDDYTFTASYEGVELSKLTVQVRYVDMNKFLRANIWWIVLITLSFLAAAIFLSTVTKRGKTTVERIERVYAVYCQCIANDTLSKEELVRIKREITRCLHHCEDLNIDAFNQYEKATRYLRKSLLDTKALMTQYDVLSPADKSVMYERLNADLGKALNVAKEIENAKGLIEQYHANANKKNFEVNPDDPKANKKAKK